MGVQEAWQQFVLYVALDVALGSGSAKSDIKTLIYVILPISKWTGE